MKKNFLSLTPLAPIPTWRSALKTAAIIPFALLVAVLFMAAVVEICMAFFSIPPGGKMALTLGAGGMLGIYFFQLAAIKKEAARLEAIMREIDRENDKRDDHIFRAVALVQDDVRWLSRRQQEADARETFRENIAKNGG